MSGRRVRGPARALGLALCLCPLLGAAADKTLGGTASKGALLTRDELRVCIQQQQDQQQRVAALERRRADNAAETEAARRQKQDVQAERDAYQAKVDAVQARIKAHADRVTLYNQRLKDFQDNPPKGKDAEYQRGVLEGEGDAIAQADAAIKADAQRVGAELEQARQLLVTHAQAQAAAVASANEHNRQFNADAKAYDDELDGWTQRCGDRPYREADERAVRAGK
ncbi:MAG: hypothetical protein U1F53_07675 [Burkholderiaceae bacterium]